MVKRGIVLPFRITTGDADIATAQGPELRRTRLETILGMRASVTDDVGEIEWDPARGSRLDALRNAPLNDALADFAAVYVEEAILAALPEEAVTDVRVVYDESEVGITVQTKLAVDASRAPKTVTASTTVKR